MLNLLYSHSIYYYSETLPAALPMGGNGVCENGTCTNTLTSGNKASGVKDALKFKKATLGSKKVPSE